MHYLEIKLPIAKLVKSKITGTEPTITLNSTSQE